MKDLPAIARYMRLPEELLKYPIELLNQGYEMSQFSIYMLFCVGKEQATRRIRDIATALPDKGSVHVLSVTDRQFEQMAVFRGHSRKRSRSAPGQLALF